MEAAAVPFLPPLNTSGLAIAVDNAARIFHIPHTDMHPLAPSENPLSEYIRAGQISFSFPCTAHYNSGKFLEYLHPSDMAYNTDSLYNSL